MKQYFHQINVLPIDQSIKHYYKHGVHKNIKLLFMKLKTQLTGSCFTSMHSTWTSHIFLNKAPQVQLWHREFSLQNKQRSKIKWTNWSNTIIVLTLARCIYFGPPDFAQVGHSRSYKVVDFGTNWKGVCDFLSVINSNFSSIMHHFWDAGMATYWLKMVIFSYPTLI